MAISGQYILRPRVTVDCSKQMQVLDAQDYLG
jgi:hypothetical protein